MRLFDFFETLLRRRRDIDDEREREAMLQIEMRHAALGRMTTENVRRIKAANTDIIEAIRAKGVDVPEGTRIDELGAYILRIEIPEEEEGDI